MRITLQQQIWFSSNATNRLKSLKPVFKKLLLVHQAYIDGEGNHDCPYWYNERPHISLLAAAVWLSGGTALEEYGTKKTKERKHGRCDLFIRTNKKTDFECEAKWLWLNLRGNVEVSCDKVNEWLKWAVEETNKLQGRKRLALCFVTPTIHKTKARVLDARLRKCIKLLKRSPEHDALVWIGIARGQKPFGKEFKHPGLLLAIKEVR